MTEKPAGSNPLRLASPSGLSLEINANGSLRSFDCNGISLALFVGNEVEGGPANLYLRRHSDTIEWTPLLGPLSRTRFSFDASSGQFLGIGSWEGVDYCLRLVLSQSAPAWFWHLGLRNTSASVQHLDLTYAQDLALAQYGGIRLNEFYVSQYVDHTPLPHSRHGVVIASRQNLAADGRFPWSLIGSLRSGTSFATDAKQFHGLATRSGEAPVGLTADLPGKRLQHEHSMVVIRDAPIRLDAGQRVTAGFFGLFRPDHPDATSAPDLEQLTPLLAQPEAQSPFSGSVATADAAATPAAATLFSAAPLLRTLDLETATLRGLFGPDWRHEELDELGGRLSFFHGIDKHVVLRSKELRAQRPHGALLRTGRHTTPDESALTSTAWMSGVFHSMVTQGHVSINRFLSTVHSYLGLFRSHGQRVFVEIDGAWQLLHLPSAFEMEPEACRWIYRHAGGEIQVRAGTRSEPHELTLAIEITSGNPARFLISHHVALNGDDGSAPGSAIWQRDGAAISVTPAPGSEIGRRFPNGSFRIAAEGGTKMELVGGDELLFLDGQSRGQPFICIVTAPATRVSLGLQGNLIAEDSQTPLRIAAGDTLIPKLTFNVPAASPLAEEVARLADIVPWYAQNALVHYLSPRGLEQFSGGGWGTRDVCQGPVEMLFALGRIDPIRDLLLRVLSAQNPDGDWPQWFMFFERERGIRAGDSHGDIVFWPLVVLAQYLIASGDAGLLDEQVRFFDSRGADAGESATVWQHVERALSVIHARLIPGTALAAYGHGDWNDSLQPADPALRQDMCSAWTVTLHFQTLLLLARSLRKFGRADQAASFEASAAAVKKDFQRLLVADGVLTGYAHFESGGHVRYLLHPSDQTTGVRYSSLAMIHAILEDLLTPEQARAHLKLIDTYLTTPDGVRLFDRPMTYHGGLQRIFQRAETATFFGREIGLMYMHAHLRYAQALAHVGDAERFFRALCQANPIGIRSIVPSATLRQSNCYYSSSDAAFEDRYQASSEYERIAHGTIALDGGWRVYSSGAGIALGLIVRHFIGVSCESDTLRIDPVIPPALDGMSVATTLLGRPLTVRYRIGAAGAGVNGISLNGQQVAFTVAANPHRRGAGLVPLAAVLEGVTVASNILEIAIG